MKIIKSKDWVRLRGQLIDANSRAKIDTLVSDVPRAFIVPESDAEKRFFELDAITLTTGIPIGPTTHDPVGEWGWRFYDDEKLNDEYVKKFEFKINEYMVDVDKVLDEARKALTKSTTDSFSSITKFQNEKTSKLLN